MNHPILGQTALAYSPVIDRNRTVIATRLTVMPLTQDTALNASALLTVLADTWPEGGQQLWLNVASESLLQDLLQAEIPGHIYIEVPAFMAIDAANSAALLALHERRNTLLLKGRPLQELPREVLPCFKHALIDYTDDRRIQLGNPNQPSIAPEGTIRSISHAQVGITSIEEMELSFRKGAIAVLGWPIDNV
ncbi:MAG: histidine kinase, partial [Aquabacterium sp.]|nr:histidine kinase [Aquabacterium sp.]